MKSDYPNQSQIPQLRELWKEAFGDSDAFLDIYFSTAFASRRCRCISEDGQVLAALYWFDVSCRDRKFAYVYAVATAQAARGRGLCRALMTDTASLLGTAGYRGILLVPQDEGLFSMYAGMGYLPAAGIRECLQAASDTAVPVRLISAREFAQLRPALLPPDSVLQEGENLDFLASIAYFYQGPGFLATVSREPEHLRILEYLGDYRQVGNLIAALGSTEATVRSPGNCQPYSMYLPLVSDCPKPDYFAFCFD